MWIHVQQTPDAALADALEIYRKSDPITRECVTAQLLGCDTPLSFDRLEEQAIKAGSGSWEDHKHDAVIRNVNAIFHSLKAAGFKAGELPSKVS
jgi:hypothetical protein